MKAGPGRPKGPDRRRVQVTLSVETWAKVEAIADRLKEPKAKILAELIDQALPALDLTIQALDLAQSAPREAQRLLTNFGAEKMMELHQQQLELDALVTKKQGGGKRGRTP